VQSCGPVDVGVSVSVSMGMDVDLEKEFGEKECREGGMEGEVGGWGVEGDEDGDDHL